MEPGPSRIQFGGPAVNDEIRAGPSSVPAGGLTVDESPAGAPAPRDRSRSPHGRDEQFHPADNSVCFSIETYNRLRHRGRVDCSGKPLTGETVCVMKCVVCSRAVDMIRLLPMPGVIDNTSGRYDFERSSGRCCNREYSISYDGNPATFWITPNIVKNRTDQRTT